MAASTSSGAATAPSSPSTGAAAAPAGSIYTIAVTMNAGGTSDELTKFLDQLQHVEPRAVLIGQADLKPTTWSDSGQKITSAGQTTLALSMTLFVQTSTS